MRVNAFIGLSGWSYPQWKDGFYAGVPRARWLQHCAMHFNSVEINASFYRLQTPEILSRWRDETPPDFRFTMKGNRYLTHSKRLRDPVASVRLERERAQSLDPKLLAVVWQLPASLGPDLQRLETFAGALASWPETRHAIEFRHRGWFEPEVAEALGEHRLAVCQSDAADWPLWDAVTTDVVYVRLHGHTRTYASRYSSPALRGWAQRIEGWLADGRTVHVYFDNDAEGAAPRDAKQLAGMLTRSHAHDRRHHRSGAVAKSGR